MRQILLDLLLKILPDSLETIIIRSIPLDSLSALPLSENSFKFSRRGSDSESCSIFNYSKLPNNVTHKHRYSIPLEVSTDLPTDRSCRITHTTHLASNSINPVDPLSLTQDNESDRQDFNPNSQLSETDTLLTDSPYFYNVASSNVDRCLKTDFSRSKKPLENSLINSSGLRTATESSINYDMCYSYPQSDSVFPKTRASNYENYPERFSLCSHSSNDSTVSILDYQSRSTFCNTNSFSAKAAYYPFESNKQKRKTGRHKFKKHATLNSGNSSDSSKSALLQNCNTSIPSSLLPPSGSNPSPVLSEASLQNESYYADTHSNWIHFDNWTAIFKKFKHLRKLQLTLGQLQCGFDYKQIMQLQLSRPDVSSNILNNLEVLSLDGITSSSFQIVNNCYLPKLQTLELGFIAVHIGSHDIKRILDEYSGSTNISSADVIPLRRLHPLKRLALYTDNDEDEQLRVALLLNRFISAENTVTILLPQLKFLQVPRLGMLPPHLPTIAPNIEELFSFQTWEFAAQYSLGGEYCEDADFNSAPDTSVIEILAEFQVDQYENFLTFSTSHTTRVAQKIEIKPSDMIETYGSNLTVNGEIQTEILQSILKNLHKNVPAAFITKNDVEPKLEAISYLTIRKTPSILRLIELLKNLPSLKRIAFYKNLDEYSFAALQKYLQEAFEPHTKNIVAVCQEGAVKLNSINIPNRQTNFLPMFLTVNRVVLNDKHFFDSQFTITSGIQLLHFFNPSP